MNKRVLKGVIGSSLLLLSGCRTGGPEGAETAPVGPSVLSEAAVREALAGPVDFRKHIQPVLAQSCVPCHNKKTSPELVDLSVRSQVMQAGPYGARVVPGDPGRSLLVSNLSRSHAPVKAMPPVGNRLTPDEVRILKKWIREGAVWPER